MPNIAKVNNVAAADIAKVNNVAKASIETVNGLTFAGAAYANEKCVAFDPGASSQSYMPLVFATTKGLTGSTDDATYALFEQDNAWSVSMWCKPISTGGIIIPWGRYDGIVGVNGSFSSAGAIYVFLRNALGGSNYILGTTANTTVYDGNWHHVCWTYAGNGNRADALVYFDGSAVSFTYSGIDIGTSNSTQVADDAFCVGNRETASTYNYKGRIDEVSLWDVELSSAEVSEIYNTTGDPTDLNSHSQASNLVHWFRLGDATGDVINWTNGDGGTNTNTFNDASTAAGYTRAIGTTNRITATQAQIVTDAP